MLTKLTTKLGIAGKLVLSVLVTFFITFLVVGSLVYNEVQDEITASTERENENLAHSMALGVKNSLDQAMTVARTVGQTVEADLQGPHSLSRNDVLLILRRLLDSNPDIIGAYVGFEPNAFDSQDNNFKNSPGHDASGRFIPYINKLTGEVTLDPLLDYETEGAGDYYLIPRKTGRESLIEPYLYNGVMLTSLVVPIKDAQGNFLGIAGVDVGLAKLDEMVSQIKIFDTGYATLISNKGAYLSHPNKIMLGYSTLEGINAANIRKAFKSGTGLYKKDATNDDITNVEKMESETTPQMRETFTKLAAEVRTGKSGTMKYLNNYSGQSQWTFYEPISVGATDTPWSLLVNVPPDEALAPLGQIVIHLLAVAVGALIVITLVVLLSARRVVRPINTTVYMLQDIAEGEGDLTRRLTITSRDEAGELARWFNVFIDKVATVVRQVAQSVREVEQGSGQLATAIEEQTKAISEVTTIVGESAKGAQDQNAGINSVRESITQLSTTIQQIAKGAHEQAVVVEKTSGLSSEMVDYVGGAVNMIKDIGNATKANADQAAHGTESVDAVVRGMENIRSVTDQALQSVSKLDDGSKQIGAIIEVINNIADQTNLLALNAAIEAARAGEHGKGFAVVADEVRVLAEKAKNSTNEISEIIRGLSLSIEDTITAVQNTGQHVTDGTQLAGEASNLLKEIEKTASETVQGIDSLLALAENLDQRSKEVGKAMSSVAAVAEQNSASAQEMTATSQQVVGVIESIAAVSEQNAAGAEEVASLSEEQNATTQEMAASANTLAASSAKLKEMISQFKTE